MLYQVFPAKSLLSGLSVKGMTLAELTIFSKFHAITIVLPILHGIVVSLLTFCAS